MTPIDESLGPVRQLEVHSPGPDDPCYASHRLWSVQLAVGYATALAAYHAGASEERSSP
jgi:hypothetical protein